MPRRRSSTATQRRTGGRSARVVASVHTAVLRLLAEHGYERLSVAEIAKLAGVHETSIYRRWPTKGRLVSDAIIHDAAEDVPPPDSGSFRRDVLELLQRVVARLRTPLGKAIAQVVASQDPDLAAVRRAYWASRKKGMRQIVARAQERGELPRSLEPGMAFELLSGPLLLRFTSGQSVSKAYLEELVARLTTALKS